VADKMIAIIKQCSCSHPSQDKLHGKNMRVFNAFKTKQGTFNYRCTVCGREAS
jgi:hypothetical protein